MAAPKKNRFAAKLLEELHGESLFVRLRRHEKAIITKAAADREVLVKAAEDKIGKQSEPSGSPTRRIRAMLDNAPDPRRYRTADVSA